MTDSAAQLLSELNEWEQKYGPLGGGKDHESTGEVTARIAALKRLLREQGAEVSWNGAEYVLDRRQGDGT
jgi:hypothetical protein